MVSLSPSERLFSDAGDPYAGALSCPGPAVLLGPAGSGKTTLLVERVACQLEEGIPRDAVLLLAVSRQGADDLSRRLLARLGTSAPRVATFHSFAFHLVKSHYQQGGYARQPRFLAASELWEELKRALARENPTRWPRYGGSFGSSSLLALLNDLLAGAASNDLSPEQIEGLLSRRGRPDLLELAGFAGRYDGYLKERCLLDSERAVLEAFRLLEGNPDLLAGYQARYRQLLVDQFEDATFVQARLARLLGEDGLFVAGNPLQGVNSYRGGSPSYLRDLAGSGEARVLRLSSSHRPAVSSLALEARLFSPAGGEGGASNPVAADVGTLRSFRYQSEESAWIAGQIAGLLRSGVLAEDVAVLFRTGSDPLARDLAIRLARLGVPVRSTLGATSVGADPMVAAAMDVLRYLSAPGEERPGLFRRLLASPLGGLTRAEIRSLRRIAQDGGASIWELARAGTGPGRHEDKKNHEDGQGVSDALTPTLSQRERESAGWHLPKEREVGCHAERSEASPRAARPMLPAGTGSFLAATREEGNSDGNGSLPGLGAGRSAAEERVPAPRLPGPAADLARCLAALEALDRPSPADLLWQIWATFPAFARQTMDDGAATPHALASPAAYRAFLEEVSRVVEAHPSTSAADVIQLYDEGHFHSLAVSPNPTSRSGVTLATVHQARNEEWPHLFLPNLVEGVYPLRRSPVGNLAPMLLRAGDPEPEGLAERHLAEERRILYVAITRAVESVCITASAVAFDGTTRLSPSRYLGVLALEDLDGRDDGSHGRTPQDLLAHYRRQLRSGDLLSQAVALHALGRLAELYPDRVRSSRWWDNLDPTEGAAPPHPDGSLHLSASRLSSYRNCPLAFKFGQHLRLEEVSSDAMTLGTLLHDVLEAYHAPGSPYSRTREALEELVEERYDPSAFTRPPVARQVRRRITELLDLYFPRYGEADGVVAVETPFRFQLGPHTVAGRIDRIDRLSDGTLELIDYKSGGAMSHSEAESDIQLALYALAFAHVRELAALGVPGRATYLYPKAIGPRADGRRSYQPTEDGQGRLLARIDRYSRGILEERFPSRFQILDTWTEMEPEEVERVMKSDPCRNCSFTWLCPEKERGLADG